MGKKRRCLLWAALLAFVMMVPSPGWACGHYNVSVFYENLIPAGNKVEPQVGVPGYTGDLVCPDCGQVCERGIVLPALPATADHPAATDAETGEAGTEQVAQEPQQPENPSDGKAEPEYPMQEEVLQPPGEKAEEPAADQGGKRPPQIRQEAAPVQLQEEDRKAESAGTSSGGGGTAKKAEEKKTSIFDFSFRRTRFKPEAGIRADAAGALIWPVSTSPLQQMNRR